MKAAVEHVEQEYAFSQRRACGLLMVAVSSVRYQARNSDEDLRAHLVELAREKPRFGYRRLQVLLRRSGEVVNHKRVHRVYREAGLALRRKKRKHCARQSAPLRQYTAANQEWALDFVHDEIAAGRAIRVLSVVDAFTRECLALPPLRIRGWRSRPARMSSSSAASADASVARERSAERLGMEETKV